MKITTFKQLEIGDKFQFEYELGIAQLYYSEKLRDDNVKFVGTYQKTSDKMYKLIELVPIYTDRKVRKIPAHVGMCIPNTPIKLA